MDRDWDDGDVTRVRERLSALAGGLPDVELAESHGHTGYLVRNKRFGWLHADQAPPGEQQSLVGADPERYVVPPYLGPKGWVGVRLDPVAAPDWDEVAGLFAQAWRMTAAKRAVAAYDEHQGGRGADD